ncbi:hypothetical protein AMTRI_Chr13g119890 [Amborella trichopoda]
MELFAFGFLKHDGFISLMGKQLVYIKTIYYLVNLLMSSTPENFMNLVIREKNYNALDNKKVACICEKFKDSQDSLLGSLASRNSKQTTQRRSMDALK